MYLTTEKKAELFAQHGKTATDTGSAEGQIALITFRINHLTEHLKQNKNRPSKEGRFFACQAASIICVKRWNR